MKIGIITQPLHTNYGGILQNYALQQTLKKLGHTPYTFDLGLYTYKDWAVLALKRLIIKIVRGGNLIPTITPQQKDKQEYPLRQFVQKYISLVQPRQRKLSKSAIHKYGMEALLVGSDQVWRPRYNYNISDMFLKFANGLNIKRIAYAASFGTAEWEYTEEQTSICRQLSQQFDAISVREDSAVELCRKHLNIEATHLIDPTLLLTAEDYNKLLVETPKACEDYIFVYILDITDQKLSYVNEISQKMGLPVKIKSADNALVQDDSIEKWLAHYRDAQYIITDSFHGSIFSVIYNKPFLSIGNKSRGLSRFNSLFSMFDLQDRLIDPAENEPDIITTPDWDKINSKIKSYQQQAITFLTDNL